MPAELLAIILGCGVGGAVLLSPVFITRMILAHREKVLGLKNRQEGAPGLVSEVEALRREIAALRETTTHFDMSFDAALHRVEERLSSVEAGAAPRYQSAATTDADTLYNRR